VSPDALIVPSGEEGHVYLVANKKARRSLSEGFERPRPVWRRTEGGDFCSPEYRSLEVEKGPAIAAMLWHLHDTGFRVVYWCEGCENLHLVTDKRAEEAKFAAISGAAGTLPTPDASQ
jgi:hypothetical protein